MQWQIVRLNKNIRNKEVKIISEEHLAAVCGLYCGACILYRACRDGNQARLVRKTWAELWGVSPEKVDCEGCLGGGKLSPYCRNCKILHCPSTKKDVKRCSDCPDFPCDIIISFNNDGVRRHAEALDNIRYQHKVGIKLGSKSRSRDGNVHSAAHQWPGTLVSAIITAR